MALASAGQEAVWMRLFISELYGSSMKEIIVFEDNQSAIQIAKNPQFHERTKHIEIIIRELVGNGVVKVFLKINWTSYGVWLELKSCLVVSEEECWKNTCNYVSCTVFST